jgi:DNA repair protein RecO (recombination protein O)
VRASGLPNCGYMVNIAYKAFISQIAKLEQQARYWSLRLFENNLLSELGYGYDLENDIHGDDIAQGAYYQ